MIPYFISIKGLAVDNEFLICQYKGLGFWLRAHNMLL